MPEFHRIKPLLVNVSIPSGSVHVFAEERETVDVNVTPLGGSKQDREAAEATLIDLANDELLVEAPKGSSYLRNNVRLKVEIHTPSDSGLKISVASASVRCQGRFQNAAISTASGDVEIDDVAGNAKINSASGDVKINDIGGQLRAKTASGELTVASSGRDATLRTASGDLTIGIAHSDVRSKAASGDLNIATVHQGTIFAESASGDVTVGVVEHASVWLDLNSLSGSINNDLDTSGENPDLQDLSIHAQTKSGDIGIKKARLPSTV
jgi:DUF4097 and DUF4098 domain-containing protein YvlB